MKQASLQALKLGVLPIILMASKGEKLPNSAATKFAIEQDFVDRCTPIPGLTRNSCTRPNGRKLLAEVIQECSKAMLI